ncbi:TPA: aminoglycoside 6'-N-acetyltransferase [Serratia marcescens]|nr:aminoglycoside 6'-N-acetyltransferase [Serratia marcescens]HAT3731847.1 aminoglycoside 6'-N-acetyltransferase [Serratia marcescens]
MIVICDHDNLDAWLALRAALWPSSSPEDHRAEMREILASPHHSAFMARGLDGAFVGFAEVALRYDYVNGCESSPVAFLEGIYTVEGARRQGWAARLIAQVQEWAKQQGCSELASDTDIANLDSQRLHAALGFAETERVVFYRKTLG